MANTVPSLKALNLPNAKVAPLLCDVQEKIKTLFCRELYFRRVGIPWSGLNDQGTALLNEMYALQNNPQASVLEYDYVYLGATTATDPASGFLKFNNTTLASATRLYISETTGDEDSIDIETKLLNATKIMVFQDADPAIYAVFTVTGVIDNGTWDTLVLTYVEGAGALTNLDPVTFVIQNNDDDFVDILQCWYNDRYS